jgi:hypothetical protein
MNLVIIGVVAPEAKAHAEAPLKCLFTDRTKQEFPLGGNRGAQGKKASAIFFPYNQEVFVRKMITYFTAIVLPE